MLRGWPLIALLLAAGYPAGAQVTVSPTASTRLADAASAIDEHFLRFQRERHVPGIVWGIVRDGRIEHLGSSGVRDIADRRPVDGDTLFRIASMSKAFTALAILKLRDEGRLSLEAPAETYVPEMRGWKYPTEDSPPIRVRDLLNHTAGFVTDDPWGDRQTPLPESAFTAYLKSGVPFNRPPQSGYEYSNLGYAILGRVIANVSGRPFADYIGREIMQPLGMQSTGYDVFRSPKERRALGYRWENGGWVREPDMAHGAFGSMGGVQTSANDYARWIGFLLSAWPPRNGPEQGPAKRSTIREMAQGSNFQQMSQRPGRSAISCPQAGAYGMGMRIAVDCQYGLTLAHGGGYPGYGSYLLLLPDYGVGLFAFTNATYAAPAPAIWDAAATLHAAGYLAGRSLPVSDALAATYKAVGALYREGQIAPARKLLAMNFLMDRSEGSWLKELAALRAQVGHCDTNVPIAPSGALSATFSWRCERGRISGSLLLAPTAPPAIQSLRLSVQALQP